MPESVLALATSDNSMGGAILTFAFPIILFVIIATVLYILLFSRPVPRVPAGHVSLAAAGGAPDPGAAHTAAVAAGMPTASGGGSAESATEPPAPSGTSWPRPGARKVMCPANPGKSPRKARRAASDTGHGRTA